MKTRRDVFQAIADPTRREIIQQLLGKPLSLSAIAVSFQTSRQAVSKHIQILTECGLVAIRRKGRERVCEIRVEKLNEVVDWVEQSKRQWAGRFGKLEKLLEENRTKDGNASTQE